MSENDFAFLTSCCNAKWIVNQSVTVTRPVTQCESHIDSLGQKGRICHFVKWQIRPFRSKGVTVMWIVNSIGRVLNHSSVSIRSITVSYRVFVSVTTSCDCRMCHCHDRDTAKHETLSHYLVDVGPAVKTMYQHSANIGPRSKNEPMLY